MQSQTPSKCRNGCGFYGNSHFDDMCSKCYKEKVKRQMSVPVNTTSNVGNHVTSNQSSVTNSSSLGQNVDLTCLGLPGSCQSLCVCSGVDSPVIDGGAFAEKIVESTIDILSPSSQNMKSGDQSLGTVVDSNNIAVVTDNNITVVTDHDDENKVDCGSNSQIIESNRQKKKKNNNNNNKSPSEGVILNYDHIENINKKFDPDNSTTIESLKENIDKITVENNYNIITIPSPPSPLPSTLSLPPFTSISHDDDDIVADLKKAISIEKEVVDIASSSSMVLVSSGTTTDVLKDVIGTTAESSVAIQKRNKCLVCKKKVGLIGFGCRCGGLFCGLHRYTDKHPCSFDYKSEGQQEIRKNNPACVTAKINKI